MRILLTGATGMLGQAVQSHSFSKKIELLCSATGVRAKSAPSFFPFDLRADQSQYDQFLRELRPDLILHGAACTNIRDCESNPELAYEINASPLAKFVVASPETKIIYVSTDAVYGKSERARTEGAALNPVNCYGKSKLRGEELLLEKSPNGLVLRTTLVGLNPLDTNFGLSAWILNSVRAGKVVRGFTDAIFSPITVWQFARELEYLLDSSLSGIFNLAGAEADSKFRYAKELTGLVHSDKVDLVEPAKLADSGAVDAVDRVLNQSLDCTKYEAASGRKLPGFAAVLSDFVQNAREV